MGKVIFWCGVALLVAIIIRPQLFRRDAAPPSNLTQSRYLGDSAGPSAKRSICVVFVHGVFGNDTTWGVGELTLPNLLATDKRYADKINIFLFEYPSPYLNHANKISDLAEQLRGALEDHHVWEHDQVIFVAHSMGGLIVRQYLASHREHLNLVPMLYLYAVPTNGSALAQVAGKVSRNPQLAGMIPLQGNDFLSGISNTWRGSEELKQIRTFCAFESLPTDGIWIVPEDSATALCTEAPDPLSGDHIEIVKPSSRDDPRFTRLATAISTGLREAASPSSVSHDESTQQISKIKQKVVTGAAIAGVQGEVVVTTPPENIHRRLR